MTQTEKHREAGRKLWELCLNDGTPDAGYIIAIALADFEREGMKRAAEIARKIGKNHVDYAALGLPIEPSKIIADDRARVANKIADRILSECGGSHD